MRRKQGRRQGQGEGRGQGRRRQGGGQGRQEGGQGRRRGGGQGEEGEGQRAGVPLRLGQVTDAFHAPSLSGARYNYRRSVYSAVQGELRKVSSFFETF